MATEKQIEYINGLKDNAKAWISRNVWTVEFWRRDVRSQIQTANPQYEIGDEAQYTVFDSAKLKLAVCELIDAKQPADDSNQAASDLINWIKKSGYITELQSTRDWREFVN